MDIVEVKTEEERQKEFKQNQTEMFKRLSLKQREIFLQVLNLFKTMDDFFESLKKQNKMVFAEECNKLALEGFLICKLFENYDVDDAHKKLLEYNTKCCQFTTRYYDEMDKDKKIEEVQYDYKPDTITMEKIIEIMPTKKESAKKQNEDEYVLIN